MAKCFLLAMLWAVTWQEWEGCRNWDGFDFNSKACQRAHTVLFDSLYAAKNTASLRESEAPRVSDVHVYEMREVE